MPENIFVKLQIPLPFIPTGGTTKVLQDDGSYKDAPCVIKETVLDSEGEPKEISVPAVCDLTAYLKGIYRLLIGLGA
ncbi:MAG: hypothetical protein QF747_02885, partial [Patescibacteria group bacterium]|nr:hypothetical protein [Patescibacteria group bacterium]